MQPFAVVHGVAAALPLARVDTDLIFPARFLKTLGRTGLGDCLFYDLRFTEDGREREGFVLNRAPQRHAQILIAYEDFGVGSSREHAAWALRDFGVRAIIAPSFADIFEENCFQNGLLPVRLPADACGRLMSDAAGPSATLTVDLERQVVVRPDGEALPFAVEASRRRRLLEGVDEIDLILARSDAIERFEARRAAEQPWMPSLRPTSA